jgi:hypothetical protein
MQVLCYVTPNDKNRFEITQCIQVSVNRANVEYFTTTEDFKERLLLNLNKKTVAVVSIATEKDLIDLYFIQHLLGKVLLVLLLPDAEPHIIAMGHRLHPFFMCNNDIQTSDFIAALKNIINHGYAPKTSAPFRNFFDSIAPSNLPKVHCDSWIYATA